VSGLLFVPTNNFNVLNGGLATIKLTITDIEAERLLEEDQLLENNFNFTRSDPVIAYSGNLTDATTTAEISIRVAAVNDRPEIHVPGEVYSIDPTGSQHKSREVTSVRTLYVIT
tara:strand:- start:149 stop:490 length:342 start_codon:yes stop_codon:yes gene_type:complete